MMKRQLFFPALMLCLALGTSFVQAQPTSQVTPPPEPVFSTEEPPSLPPGIHDPATVVTVMVRVTEPTRGQSATRAQRAQAQQRLLPQIESRGGRILFQTQLVYNGIAVAVPAGKIAGLQALTGVADVQVIVPKSQIEADIPALISSSLTQATPAGVDGAGVRVGVIDSGIDYTHADFGGPGTPAAYAANDRTIIEPGTFPTTKVVGGYDFAGDAYSATGDAASVIPVPDPDPLDCTGRGTHIAGVIAGSGVNSNGTSYGGPYASTNNYGSFQVPPGVAPQARLYGLKVFGCDSAATTLTTQALEWAVDPDGNGDTADHLDVVIIALSTPFGSPDDPDALAVQRATELGVTVVAAAGDGAGSFYSINAFGTAPAALSVGASIGSPQPLNAPDENYTDPDCFASGDLVGKLLNNTQGQLTNYSTTCTYMVGMASYRKFDNVIDHQHLFDSEVAEIAPGQTITITIDLPGCAAQIDLFRGPVLYSLNGRRYNTRLLLARHIGSINYCPPESAPVYGLPETASRGIQRGTGELKPDVVAPAINIRSASFGTGTDSVEYSTSWAGAAQVAGAAALVKGQYPGWTPAQIKAALMNTASPVLMDDKSLYPPSLAGAGQLDISRLTTINLLAEGQAAGTAALSYGAPTVSGPWTEARTLRLENPGDSVQRITLGQLTAANEPGVSLTLPAGPLDVPAHGALEVPVVMTIDPAQLDFTPDAATNLAILTGGVLRPRFYLAEHSGYIQVRSSGAKPLTVPFVVMPRSGSEATAAASSLVLGAGESTFALPLTNTGARNAGTLNGTNNAQVALVSAFELLETSPARTGTAPSLRAADLHYFGVTSNIAASSTGTPSLLYLGFATYAPWSTPNEIQFRVLIDTNLDQVADFVLLNYSWPNAQGGASDLFRFALYRTNSDGSLGAFVNDSSWNTFGPYQTAPNIDVAPFNTSVAFGALAVGSLELPGGQTTLNLRVESRARDAAGFTSVVDQMPASGWHSYDIAHPAVAPLARTGIFASRPLFFDADGASVSGSVQPALQPNTSLLLLHHHNQAGTQAEVVPVDVANAQVFAGTGGAQRIYAPLVGSR